MQPWKTPADEPELPARPQLKPWYRRVEIDDAIVLEYGHSALVFGGRAAARLLPVLLPLLDGTRTTAALVDELGPASEPAVRNALRLLDGRGLLLDGEPPDGAEPEAVAATTTFLAATGHDATLGGVRASLARASVAVVGEAAVADRVVELLQCSGVQGARRAGWDAAAPAGGDGERLVVAAPDAGEVEAVDRWNRTALETGTVWLQILPFDGRFVPVGPLYVPGETCCYECYRSRRGAASGYGAEFRAVDDAPLGARATPALDSIVAGVAATLVLRWVALRDHYLPGVFHACEAGGLALTQHRVYRVPRCAVCSGLRDVATPLPWFKEVVDERPAPEAAR